MYLCISSEIMMETGMKCIKYLLFIFNLLFAVSVSFRNVASPLALSQFLVWRCFRFEYEEQGISLCCPFFLPIRLLLFFFSLLDTWLAAMGNGECVFNILM